MFRYIALAWNESKPSRASLARRLGQSMHGSADWQAVLLWPGLQVFMAGARRGVNGSYRLGRQGVVLGKLFRRATAAGSADFEFSDNEADRILKSQGQALVDDFWGRYVAFLPDASSRNAVLRDPSGTLPCYRMECGGVHLVFSWLEDLLEALPGLPRPVPDKDAVAACVLSGRLTGRLTALHGVTQILPGERACLEAPGDTATALWRAADVAGRPLDIAQALAADELRRTVRDCAHAWAGCYDAILLRLSGGLDSSILLSCLSQSDVPADITCLNYHSPGADSDEREYARLAASSGGRLLIERERDTQLRLENLLDVAHTPAPESYLGRMGTSRRDADAAREHGAIAMFTGAGGDQLFYERHCTWPAADYLRLHGLDSCFFAVTLDVARLARVSVWKVLQHVIADRFRRIDPLAALERPPALASQDALAAHPRADRFAHPESRRASSLPVGKREQVLELQSAVAYYDPYLREAAPELVNPLLSQPLIELCLRLPSYALTCGGRSRGLARRAFASDIPPQIATRYSKGGMEEQINAVLKCNLAFVRSLLLDGRLVDLGLLDRNKLAAALAGRSAAAGVYVADIHDYVAIEAWLQRWSGARA